MPPLAFTESASKRSAVASSEPVAVAEPVSERIAGIVNGASGAAHTARAANAKTTSMPVEFLLPVSSHTAEGLVEGLRDYAALLRQPGSNLERVARAAARMRDHGDFRVAVAGATAEEVAGKLEARAETAISLQAEDGLGGVCFSFCAGLGVS